MLVNGTVAAGATEYIVRGRFSPQSVVDILRSVKYHNVEDEPTLYTRSVEITVSVHAELYVGVAASILSYCQYPFPC